MQAGAWHGTGKCAQLQGTLQWPLASPAVVLRYGKWRNPYRSTGFVGAEIAVDSGLLT